MYSDKPSKSEIEALASEITNRLKRNSSSPDQDKNEEKEQSEQYGGITKTLKHIASSLYQSYRSQSDVLRTLGGSNAGLDKLDLDMKSRLELVRSSTSLEELSGYVRGMSDNIIELSGIIERVVCTSKKARPE